MATHALINPSIPKTKPTSSFGLSAIGQPLTARFNRLKISLLPLPGSCDTLVPFQLFYLNIGGRDLKQRLTSWLSEIRSNKLERH